MAVNETIVTGRKFRKCIDAATKAWQRISFWTKSSDVEFEDGKNAETKLGAIDGITDSLENTSSRMAASAKAVSTLNNNLGGCQLTQEGEDFYIVGADSVRKKLGSGKVVLLGTVTTAKTFNLSTYDGYEKFELNKNILGHVSGSYNQSTGILTVNQSTVTGYVTVSGYGYVIGDTSGIRRNGNGEMSGNATLAYPKNVYLIY